jgi:hypothetical protein
MSSQNGYLLEVDARRRRGALAHEAIAIAEEA